MTQNENQLSFPFATIRQRNPALADSLVTSKRTLGRASAEHSRAKLRMERAASEFARYVEIAVGLGFKREDVEKAVEIEVGATQATPDVQYRVSNRALMLHIAEIIEDVGHPLTMREILEGLDQKGVKLPGLEPRRNLLAYISRSPLVKSITKGVYDFDRDLLRVMRSQERSENHGG